MPGARACCKPAGRALGDGHQAWRSGCSGGGIWQVVAGDHRGPGWFNDPASAALDVQGNLYVADMGNNRIQTLSPDGQPVAKWGTRGGAPGQFHNLAGLAVDAQGNVYVADSGNERIQKLSAGAGRARDAAVGQLARVPTGGQRLTDGL